MNPMKILLPLALAASTFAAHAAGQPTANLALDAAAEYRAAARFPDSSRPILDGVDALVAGRIAQPVSAGSTPRLTVWNSGLAFESGQTVALFAQLENTRADASLLHQTLAALGKKPAAQAISASIRDQGNAVLAEVALRDDGQGADLLAGDGIHSGQWTLPAARQPAPGRAESLMVRTAASLADGQERVAVGGFQYSHPGARLTGRYRDALAQGSLRLLAEVEVLAPGRYHLSGTLADLVGKPLAEAQSATVLAPGKHWLTLDYYGLILHELAAAGPYRLQTVTLTSASAMPNAFGPLLQAQHRTAAYGLKAFTAKAFGQLDLLEAAARLERDAAR